MRASTARPRASWWWTCRAATAATSTAGASRPRCSRPATSCAWARPGCRIRWTTFPPDIIRRVAEIRPFPAIRYRVPDAQLSRVLAPPYDVITPEDQRTLYERDPRNIVRVILSRSEGDAAYRDAGETYRRWLEQGVLAADPDPALYVLEQSFVVDGRPLARVGLLARFRAEDLATGQILPHEQTRPAAREDRYRVLTATRANFSPI